MAVKLVDQLLALLPNPHDRNNTSLRKGFEHLIEEANIRERAEARREAEGAHKAERQSTMESAEAMTQAARRQMVKALQVKADAAQAKAEAAQAKADAIAQVHKAVNVTEALTAVADGKPTTSPCQCLGVVPGDPARFDGGQPSQEAVDSFVDVMESIFFFAPRLTEVQKVVLAVTKFAPNGAAAKWVRPYMHLCRAEDPTAPEWIRTWATFSAMLSNKFGKAHEIETTMTELVELRQAYTTCLYSLRIKMVMDRTDLSEEGKKAIFKLGLKPDVRAVLEGRECATLNDLIEASIAVHEDLIQKRNSASPATTN